MKSIDLRLKKHAKIDDIFYLKDAIKNNELTVVLGAPGSGKSTILEKYKEEVENVDLVSIKRFLKLNVNITNETKVLLLDGLDEYRGVSNDKTFIIEELAAKLDVIKRTNKKIRIVISCREMDWYGENDRNALKNELLSTFDIIDCK